MYALYKQLKCLLGNNYHVFPVFDFDLPMHWDRIWCYIIISCSHFISILMTNGKYFVKLNYYNPLCMIKLRKPL